MVNEFQNILLILMQLFSRLWKQLEVCVLKNKYRSWLQRTSNFLFKKKKKKFYFFLMSILFFSCHSNHSTPISFNYPDPNSKLYTICRQDLVSFDRNSAKRKITQDRSGLMLNRGTLSAMK